MLYWLLDFSRTIRYLILHDKKSNQNSDYLFCYIYYLLNFI